MPKSAPRALFHMGQMGGIPPHPGPSKITPPRAELLVETDPLRIQELQELGPRTGHGGRRGRLRTRAGAPRPCRRRVGRPTRDPRGARRRRSSRQRRAGLRVLLGRVCSVRRTTALCPSGVAARYSDSATSQTRSPKARMSSNSSIASTGAGLAWRSPPPCARSRSVVMVRLHRANDLFVANPRSAHRSGALPIRRRHSEHGAANGPCAWPLQPFLQRLSVDSGLEDLPSVPTDR